MDDVDFVDVSSVESCENSVAEGRGNVERGVADAQCLTLATSCSHATRVGVTRVCSDAH